MGRELVKVELGKALDAAALPAAMRNGALVARVVEFVETTGVRNAGLLAAVVEVVEASGPDTWERLKEYFKARLENKNTRLAYGAALARFFAWCRSPKVGVKRLQDVTPATIGNYRDELKAMGFPVLWRPARQSRCLGARRQGRGGRRQDAGA